MFASPRYVIKAGAVVVEEGQLRRAPRGRRLHVRPEYEHALLPDLRRYFEDYSTVAFENYPVPDIPDEPVSLSAS
jgi:formylmethanofuran dehydrogenase subunit A